MTNWDAGCDSGGVFAGFGSWPRSVIDGDAVRVRSCLPQLDIPWIDRVDGGVVDPGLAPSVVLPKCCHPARPTGNYPVFTANQLITSNPVSPTLIGTNRSLPRGRCGGLRWRVLHRSH